MISNDSLERKIKSIKKRIEALESKCHYNTASNKDRVELLELRDQLFNARAAGPKVITK